MLNPQNEEIRLVSGLRVPPVGCIAQLAGRRSAASELTLSCARPAADGLPLWVNRPLQVSQSGQLSLLSFLGR